MTVTPLHQFADCPRGLLIALVAISMIAGCAPYTRKHQTEPAETFASTCDRQLQLLYQQAQDANIEDVQDQPLSPFVYLRTNRTLSALLAEIYAEGPSRQESIHAPYGEWLDMSRQLGEQALISDHRNLASNQSLKHLKTCLSEQTTRLKQSPSQLQTLAQQWLDTPYPSSYRTELQVLGLYPLTKELMLLPLPRLHAELGERYHQGPAQPTSNYIPADTTRLSSQQIKRWLADARHSSALNVPRLDPSREQKLLAHFAPAWEIEQRGEYDKPGYPGWHSGDVTADISRPSTFTHLSYTDWQGQWLMQLNYLVWFTERPSQSAFDIYAGPLDGLYVRLTLDLEGNPLVVDSIHPCGCYYSVVPLQPRLKLRDPSALGEPPLLLPLKLSSGSQSSSPGQHAQPHAEQRLSIAISSADHMLLGVSWRNREHDTSLGQTAPHRYALYPEDRLRSRVPDPATATGEPPLTDPTNPGRSLYSPPYGLIPDTDRAEKVFLWPSGIVSPGAMRQRGHHAIAFSAMRHFDDADLLEQLFLPTDR